LTLNDEWPELQGLRVLAVEDEFAILLMLETMLRDLGCRLVGSAGRMADALALTQTTAAEAAVLDVNLAGHAVYPVAERLVSRRVPIVFATGYGITGVDPAWRSCAILDKPYQANDLAVALSKALKAARD
jgi:CheY-like chemotaxis protein